MKYILTLLVFSSIIIISCGKDNENPVSDCATTAKSFSADVNPIIQSSCATNAGCHGTGSINGPGPLLTYNHVFNARSSIRSAISNGSMPKNGSLSASQKASIICWIDNGGSNN
jgi:hypothetical protein